MNNNDTFLKQWCFWILLGVLTIFFVGTVLNLSMNKPFWNDENFDIGMIRNKSVITLIQGRTEQSNNNPLYYVLQKINMQLLETAPVSDLIKYRMVSIVSAVVLFIVLFVFFSRCFGVGMAVLSGLVLINQSIFIHFAAESRHYMLWMLCYVFLLLTTLKICMKKFEECSLKEIFFFCLACLSMVLVISFGVIQVFFAVVLCVWMWIGIYQSKKQRSILMMMGLFLFICAGIEIYYALMKLEFFTAFSHSSWDIVDNIRRKDFSLLKMPLRLLLPKPDDKIPIVGYCLNAMVVIGLSLPFFHFTHCKRKLSLSVNDRLLCLISLFVWLQLAATVVIGVVIAYFHFLFCSAYVYLFDSSSCGHGSCWRLRYLEVFCGSSYFHAVSSPFKRSG